jgi:hypothetical protein
MDDALMVMDESIMKVAAEEKHWQEQRCAFSLQTTIATRSRKSRGKLPDKQQQKLGNFSSKAETALHHEIKRFRYLKQL